MAFGKTSKPIIVRTEPMSDAELAAAFSVSQTHPLYRAIVQLLEDAAQENAANAASFARANNGLASAGHAVAWEEFTGFLLDIESRRQKNAD